MATTIGKVQTGNRVVVEFDDKQVGLVQSCRFSDNYGLEDASQIGDIHVQEHVPTRAVHTVAVSRMVLRQDLMKSSGLVPENGDAALKGLVFDIVVYSKDTGQAIRKAISCSYDSGDASVDANRIIVSNGTFKALDVAGTGL